MDKKVRIGVVCTARDTFDFHAAAEIFEGTKQELTAIPDVDWQIIPGLVISADEAQQAADQLAAKNLDALVIISGTFHLGHLALIFNNTIDRPVLLWAYNELPYNGGKIRLNSVCGLNLNASNLYKAGVDNYICHVGDRIPLYWVDAVRMKKAVTRSHVGLLGYRAHGFFNLSVEDLAVYRKTGLLIDHYELADAYAQLDESACTVTEEDIRAAYGCGQLNDSQVARVVRLANCFEQFLLRNKLDALAVRCWPEFAATYGISPCAAMSYLASRRYILGCEGDVEGTLSLLACSMVSEDVPFLADFSQVNLKEDFALLWHCGVASPSLWDKRSPCTLGTAFAGGKGVTADLVMKEGDITLMRMDSARGRTRLYLLGGKALPMDKGLTGSYAKAVFDQPVARVLDTIAYNGVAHHIAMAYGKHLDTFRTFARLMDMEVIE